MRKTIFANGDSWTFGSEIAAPEFLASPGEKGEGMSNRYKPGQTCFQPSNDYYRVPRLWPTKLGELLDADVVNIAWPARSNDTILASTIAWVMKNYITPGKDVSDLTVIVGWSSLERKNVLLEDFDDTLLSYTIWPAMLDDGYYKEQVVKKYFKMHVQHLWTQRESISRFVDQNTYLHHFLKSHNIKHHFFDCFYVPEKPESPFETWVDVSIENSIKAWSSQSTKGWFEPFHSNELEIERVLSLWQHIPNDVFLFKDKGTFKSFVETNIPEHLQWCGIHPSPESQHAWAEHIKDLVK